METKTIISSKFSLQARDFVKGLIMAVLTAIITFAYEIIQEGFLDDVNYATVGKVALTAGVSYIFKNWVLEPTKVISIPAAGLSEAKEIKSIIVNK